MNDSNNANSNAIEKRIGEGPIMKPGTLTEVEMRDKPLRIPRAGKIKAGLSGDDLLALAGRKPNDVAEIVRCTPEQAQKLLDRISRAEQAGKSPGILNVGYFIVKAENPVHQPEIDEILGPTPASLRVKFMINFDVTANIQYTYYRADGTAECYSTEQPGIAMRYDLDGKRVEVECKRTECPDFVEGKCARRGRLFLRLIDLEGIGIFNPFQYDLHSGTADRLINQVLTYAKIMSAGRIPLSAPEFELVKVWERRPYRGKPDKEGRVKVHTRKMQVATLLMRGAGESGRASLPAGETDNELEQRLEEDADNPIDEAEYQEIENELGPPVEHDMQKNGLVPDPEPAEQDTGEGVSMMDEPNTERRTGGKSDYAICDHCKNPIAEDVYNYCKDPKNAKFFEGWVFCRQCQEKWRKKRGATK